MLLRTSFVFFFETLFLINFPENSATIKKSPHSVCELFSSKPVPYPTPSPINVITEKAIEVHVNSTLIIENGIFIPLTVKNTGLSFEAFAYPSEHSSIQTHGGVLCNNIYVFYKVGFFFSSDPKLSSFTQINGKGAPITLRLVYYKADYKTFENALKYRDGLVIQNFLVGFTKKDNPLFYPFQYFFKYLTKPGSQVTLPAVIVYAAFNKLSVLNDYYAFLGAYLDLLTGKQNFCVIDILASREVFSISKRQFDATFGKLMNSTGGQLDNRHEIKKTGKRLIVKPDKGLKGDFHFF